MALLDGLAEPAHSRRHLIPRRVRKCNVEDGLGVGRRQPLGLSDQLLEVGRKEGHVAQDFDPDAGLGETVGLGDQPPELVSGQVHQGVHFRLRPLVVLNTEK